MALGFMKKKLIQIQALYGDTMSIQSQYSVYQLGWISRLWHRFYIGIVCNGTEKNILSRFVKHDV